MGENKAKLEGCVVRIQNQERMVRQKALKELLEFCEAEGNVTDENAIEIFDSLYLCLIKCYADRFEMCRSLACSIISEILKHLEQNDYYLSLLVPVIAKRLAVQDVVEESEELRLQLLKQLNFIIDKYKDLHSTGTVRGKSDGEDRLLKPYNDIVDILKVCLLDSYPAALKECCEIIKVTAEATPSFHYRAEALVEPLTYLLKHRHSPVRIAAIEALGTTALHILTNGDVIKRILQELSPLVMDPIAFVRREVGRVGCMFLIKLRDRYSFFERILPLVLCGLSEETLEVKNEIESLWVEAGSQYYLENQNELQQLNIIEDIPANYPDHLMRPTIGCRALVQRSLQVLNSVLHEMEDWKEDVRLHSTKLLLQIAIHCEEHLAAKYYDINAVLCKTCNDPEPLVAKHAIEVAKLVGHFVEAKTWSKFAHDELRIRQNKLGVLKCLNALHENSSDVERYRNLEELSVIFLDTSICHNNSEVFQLELMKLIEALLKGLPKDAETVFKNLYVVVLKSTAVSYDSEAVRSFGLKLLQRLSEIRDKTLNELHKLQLKSALDTLDLLDKPNNDSCEQVKILYGIICLCGFQKSLIGELKRAIIPALEHSEAEGKIKILSGIATVSHDDSEKKIEIINFSLPFILPESRKASLNWNQTIGVDDPNENFLILAAFVGETIAPLLIWHAGQTAESVRTMATASLCSLTQGTSTESARRIVESLMVPLVSLIDDHNIATRSYALKILQYVSPLNFDNLKTLAPAMLSRLDDPGSEVREKAAKCLGRLELADDDEQDLWEPLLKQILSTMLIHVESPEVNLRESLIDSIGCLGKGNPKVYREALDESTISRDLKCKLPQI